MLYKSGGKLVKKRILYFLFVFSIVLTVMGLETDIKAKAAEDKSIWHEGWHKNDSRKISVDTKNSYGNSAYSFKLQNTDYNDSRIEKTFKVKPNTYYRASVMVKYSGYELDPNADITESGAVLQLLDSNNVYIKDGFYNSEEWKKLELSFYSGDSEFYTIRLRNGFSDRECKGTAWFSDVRIEEASLSTDWNVLVLVIKHIKAEATVDGAKIEVDNQLNDNDVEYLRDAIQVLKQNISDLSEGLAGIRSIDVYALEDTVTELNAADVNKVDCTEKAVSKALDKYLDQKSYQQIILIHPLQDVNKNAKGGTWVGKGGASYKGITCCQCIYISGKEDYSEKGASSNYKKFPLSLVVHEILHGVEKDSGKIDKEKTAPLHMEDNSPYKEIYNGNDGWYSYYHDYMTCSLPDGRGVLPEAYLRISDYILVSDEMTPGEGIKTNGDLPEHIAGKLKTSKIKNLQKRMIKKKKGKK